MLSKNPETFTDMSVLSFPYLYLEMEYYDSISL
jgi:hypothetical protein